jgi:DNA-binding response OmpR family regulator
MQVLVADDDEEMRAIIAAVLAVSGHVVIEAADGAAAWAAIERDAPPLVLLDWQMPVLTGIEVCERLRAAEAAAAAVIPAGSDVPSPLPVYVVIITARGATADLRRVLDAGADDFLSKPLVPETLAMRIVIAERRMVADRARRTAEDHLRRAQWVAGIAETAIAIQHEINNPLTALMGHAALVEGGLVPAGEAADMMRIIAEQATRIAEVVRRLATLREPRSVEYLRGTRMVDLSSGGE